MCKCIYCNSQDLSVSDIISYALTGAKLTKKSVCHSHNKFTNENFEKIAIANLDFFRYSLGLSERKGGQIKYKADVTIDGITIPNISVSDRKSIYEDKKRLFQIDNNGSKSLIGNIERLKKKKDVIAEKIEPLDMSDVVVSITFSIDVLLASKEMLLTIAKIAYEWFCAVNNINEFIPEYYQKIVDSILMQRPIEDVVEIVVDGNLYLSLKEICCLGSHGLFEYTDVNGYRYVIYCFWGVIFYKILITNTHNPNLMDSNIYKLYIYYVDGDKSQTTFGVYGKSCFASVPAHEAIKQHHGFFKNNLEQLEKTIVLSLRKIKQLADDLENAFNTYKQEPHDFARLIDYEDDARITTIRLLFLLFDKKDEYSYNKSFNDNLKQITAVNDNWVFSVDEKKAYVKYLLELHERNQLSEYINKSLALFKEIFEKSLDAVN